MVTLVAFSSPAISGILERAVSFPKFYGLASNAGYQWADSMLGGTLVESDMHLPSVGLAFVAKANFVTNGAVSKGALTKRNARQLRKCGPNFLSPHSSGGFFDPSCVKRTDSGYISSDPQTSPTTRDKSGVSDVFGNQMESLKPESTLKTQEKPDLADVSGSQVIPSKPESPSEAQKRPVFPSPSGSFEFGRLRQRLIKTAPQVNDLVQEAEALVMTAKNSDVDAGFIRSMEALSITPVTAAVNTELINTTQTLPQENHSLQQITKELDGITLLDEGYRSLSPFERTVSHEEERKPADEQTSIDLPQEVQLLTGVVKPEDDMSISLLKDFMSRSGAHKGVMMEILNGVLKRNGINPKEILESRAGKETMMKLGRSLTQVSSYINTVLAWGAYTGTAYLLYRIPGDSVTAIIVVALETCEKGETLTGEVVTYQVNGQHYLPHILIAAIYLGPVFMNTFLKTILDRLGSQLIYRASCHVCKVDDCLFLDSETCALANWEAYQFFTKTQRLPRDDQMFIKHLLRKSENEEDITWVDSDIPLSAGIADIVDGLIVKRNAGYTTHALIYGGMTALWVTLWVFQRPVEVYITTSLANATIDSTGNTTNCTAIGSGTEAEVEGMITGFDPMWAGFVGKLATAWTAIYIIPSLVPFVQVGARGVLKLATSGVKWCFSRKEKGR